MKLTIKSYELILSLLDDKYQEEHNSAKLKKIKEAIAEIEQIGTY